MAAEELLSRHQFLAFQLHLVDAQLAFAGLDPKSPNRIGLNHSAGREGRTGLPELRRGSGNLQKTPLEPGDRAGPRLDPADPVVDRVT